MADILLAAASKAAQTTGCKRGGHLHCTLASTANHDLSSGRAHTLGLSATLCGASALPCMGNCKWAFLHEVAQAARWAPGRNGAQRWPRVGTAPLHISAPPPFRSTFLRQKSRAAFQGWRRGAGEAAQFLARHGTKQLIYTRSALCFRAEAPAAARTEEGKEWLAPWWADWLAAPWRQLPVCCPATLCCWRQPPTFLFIFPPAPRCCWR